MTKTRDLSDFLIEGGADLPLGKPHIVPGVLQPAIGGKLLNGANHSGAYGTAQTQSGGDGHSYYYTDIKGSKPIKDPRIGAYFGSQRHKFKSIQKLHQESATHGQNIYSVDGREWIRLCDGGSDLGIINNGDIGQAFELNDHEAFYEIVGYFSDINLYAMPDNTLRHFHWNVDGGSENAVTSNRINVDSVYRQGRFIDCASGLNLATAQTLGIHTLKIMNKTTGGSTTHQSNIFFGVELIVHDTASTARKNEIKIPKQNVVSFGKKFEVGSDDLDNAVHPHYDPFTTMSYGGSGTTESALGSLIDTSTSLGMDNWKAGTSNYHRPWNGGRVIKWVDSDGTIKTSVTMMPPNAQNINGTASNAVSNAHQIAGTNDDIANFDTTTIANATQLYEVAKTFHVREFGNGAANGGTEASFADASMLASADDTAYVMDDGLTSMYADDFNGDPTSSKQCILRSAVNDYIVYTFIGTGISFLIEAPEGTDQTLHIGQNLPYGTHIFKYKANASNSDHMDLTLDGVAIATAYNPSDTPLLKEITFYQPKRPPIPEDCVVLSDYMLMADFVPQPTAGIDYIPKGVRFQAHSRDYKIDKTAGTFLSGAFKSHDPQRRTGQYFWWKTVNSSGDTYTQELPFFGDSFVHHFSVENDSDYASPVFTLNGSALSGFTNTGNGTGFTSVTAAGVVTETGNAAADNVVNFKAPAGTLGSNTLKVSVTSNAANKYLYNRHFSIATPIHTSSHYQEFETPFLKELVGGDRNMEQHNLVCSPDGKTWDEVTRDTSYISSKSKVQMAKSDQDIGNTVTRLYYTACRGSFSTYVNAFNKDFALAYNQFICLKEGTYKLIFNGQTAGGSLYMEISIKVNDVTQAIREQNADSGSRASSALELSIHLKRNDVVSFFANNLEASHGSYWGWVQIDEI